MMQFGKLILVVFVALLLFFRLKTQFSSVNSLKFMESIRGESTKSLDKEIFNTKKGYENKLFPFSAHINVSDCQLN